MYICGSVVASPFAICDRLRGSILCRAQVGDDLFGWDLVMRNPTDAQDRW